MHTHERLYYEVLGERTHDELKDLSFFMCYVVGQGKETGRKHSTPGDTRQGVYVTLSTNMPSDQLEVLRRGNAVNELVGKEALKRYNDSLEEN